MHLIVPVSFVGNFQGISFEGDGNRYLNLINPEGTLNGIAFRNNDTVQAGFVYDSPATPHGIQFRSNTYRSRMLLASNGYVGIGNIDPNYLLDVLERIRIRSGGNNSNSAGIWFNNNANNALAAFAGMKDDTHVGFYGGGTGWIFTMNTNTGALEVNGSEGNAGQAITSSGSTAPEWKSLTKFIYDNTVMKEVNTPFILSNVTIPTAIPNLTHTFTTPGAAKVIVNFTLHAHTQSCFLCGSSRMNVDIQHNGNFITRFTLDIGNGQTKIFRGEYVFGIAAGTHTVRLMAMGTGPQIDLAIVSYRHNMIIEVIPE